MFKLKSFIKIFIFNQIVAVVISFIIVLITGMFYYFGINIALALVYSNCIGITFYILLSLFDYFFINKIDVRFIKILIYTILFIISFFIGAEIAFRTASLFFPYTLFNLTAGYENILVLTNIILILIAIFLFLLYKKIKKDILVKIEENEKLNSLKIQSELVALQSKINPHFLFNTLNTILDIVYDSPDKVEKIIINLANIYRRILYSSENEFYTLKEEFQLIKQYLEIEKVRLEDRLEYNIEIDESVYNLKIPPLIIEPIVENSVIHGISKKKEGGIIDIKAFSLNNYLEIIIKDNGIGIDNENLKFGFGVKSVEERLKIIFNTKSKLLYYKNNPDGGLTTYIKIPFVNKNEEETHEN